MWASQKLERWGWIRIAPHTLPMYPNKNHLVLTWFLEAPKKWLSSSYFWVAHKATSSVHVSPSCSPSLGKHSLLADFCFLSKAQFSQPFQEPFSPSSFSPICVIQGPLLDPPCIPTPHPSQEKSLAYVAFFFQMKCILNTNCTVCIWNKIWLNDNLPIKIRLNSIVNKYFSIKLFPWSLKWSILFL